MQIKRLFPLVGILSLSFMAGCTNQPYAGQQADNSNTTITQANNTDSHAIGWLVVLDKNEINAAKIALHRSHNPQVKNYARLMIQEHSKNLNATLKLSHNYGEEFGEKAIALREKGMEEANKLQSISTKNFDNAYINNMIAGHKEALSNLDTKIQEVQGNALKNHLLMTSKHVALHLKKAEQIENTL
ncbi:MAG: DUF4142 domain-containing protein [Gammaproteobacteria bacterium]|nr:DUF4142 domain-containing protein [Gammaproteobacteria bacterium]